MSFTNPILHLAPDEISLKSAFALLLLTFFTHFSFSLGSPVCFGTRISPTTLQTFVDPFPSLLFLLSLLVRSLSFWYLLSDPSDRTYNQT